MITLCEYTIEFLDYSWEWLNDPEIKSMTNTADFTYEDQLNWYNALQKTSDYLVWGINYNNIPIGACGLKKITHVDCEYWGYIGEKKFWGKGLGKLILEIMIEKARSFGKKSVWLKVVKTNERAFQMYTKFKFEIEEENNLEYILRLIL
jgi:RimJ/RimL family protein N-acetyltransferase